MFKFNSKNGSNTDTKYAIDTSNISKSFKIPHERKTTVYDNLIGKVTGNSYNYETFEALRNISFKVKHGETFGIIGENGCGKSTLLKVLAGVLVPDNGSVVMNGNVAPFLELGIGFQPELTAIENVYLYGAIMGINRKEMDMNLDSIFKFAELERFKDTKLKNLSSGMYARLAFATAISTDPDVLLIDEVLSVGDRAFQSKCYDKINEYKQRGKTIVFVSHAMPAVEQICDRCLFLHSGAIVSEGQTECVISDYLNFINKKETERILSEYQDTQKSIEKRQIDQSVRRDSKETRITDIKFFNNSGESYIFQTGNKFVAKIKYTTKVQIQDPVFGVAIYKDDINITGPNTKFCQMDTGLIEGDGEIELIIDDLPLLDGSYRFSAAIYDHSCQHPYDHQHCASEFKVKNTEIRNYGLFNIPVRWVLE